MVPKELGSEVTQHTIMDEENGLVIGDFAVRLSVSKATNPDCCNLASTSIY